jgi:hypothetical protein
MPYTKTKRRYTRKQNKAVETTDPLPHPEAASIAAELDRQLVERFNREELPRLQAEANAKRQQRPTPKFDFSPGYIRRMTSDLGVSTTSEDKSKAEGRLNTYINSLSPRETEILYNGFIHGIFSEEKH